MSEQSAFQNSEAPAGGLRVLSETCRFERPSNTEVRGGGRRIWTRVWKSWGDSSVEGAGLKFDVENPAAAKETRIQIPPSNSEPYPHVKGCYAFFDGAEKRMPGKR